MNEINLPLKLQKEVEKYCTENKLSGARKEKLIEQVTSIYKRSLYDPQEAIGIVTAQSLSEPATQMSISPHEKVILKRNGIITIVEMGKFVDSIVEKLGKSIGGWDVSDVSSEGIYVPSITDKEKIEWRPVKEISRHKAPKKLLKISTSSGRQITATDSHSFLIRKNNRVVPVAGKELKPGDRIPVLKYLPENCLQTLQTTSVIEKEPFIKKPLPEELRLDEELGWLFGAYLAEGNATDFYVSFSGTHPKFLSKIRNFAGLYNFSFNEYDNTRGFSPSHDIRINSKQLSRLMKKTCGTGSKNKRVPDFAYSANEEFVSALLKGYFDGDGNVSFSRKLIRVSSNSEELLDGVALLLTRFGIFAHKTKDKQFCLLIPYKYAPVFLSKIGSDVKNKRERLEKLAELAQTFWNAKSQDLVPQHKSLHLQRRWRDVSRLPHGRQECGTSLAAKPQDFTDMISGFNDLFYRTAKKLKYPTRYVNNFTKRQRIGRTTLCRYINLFKKLAAEKNVDISSELKLMESMCSSDVIWDKIIKIESVKPSGKYVYDFTVPGTETFTTFDGVVTHNTMRTYHFAGTAGIQVTLGLPRMLEIFDARKEPTTPTMTIRILPEYQEKEKVKKIAEQIKEIKVRNVTTSFSMDVIDGVLRCRLNTEKLRDLDIKAEEMVKLIKLRNAKIVLDGATMIVTPTKKDIRNLHKLKQSLLDTRIKGIKNVIQAVVTKEGDDEWIITTLGSNLKKVLPIEGVDVTRTISNNLFEVQEVFGIEAARNAIINQTRYTMEEQGLNVDYRYIMLLADLMTVGGEIKSIGRYGISGKKASVMVRASFEETKKHVVSASVKGEVDPLRGTIENVMLNQIAPIGTGVFELVGHIPSKKKKKPKKKPAVKKPEAKKKKAERKPVKKGTKKKIAKTKKG
jgi:DNA-directed RNA polymerase subunit A"